MSKFFLALFLIPALIGCNKSPSQSQDPHTKITVSYTTQPQSTLIHVAVAKGYFAEEGLEVQSLLHSFGKPSLQTLLDHKSDFAAVAETPIMFNILKGEKFFVIANIEATTTNNAIVARKDAGITKAADLKGKRIAFTPGTTSDFFLDSILTVNGLTRKDIQPMPLKPDEMLAAIMAKNIDAACTWNFPLTQISQFLGENGTLIFDKEIYTETYNVTAQQDFVQKNPETVKSFLRALIKAENFVHKYPDDAQTIMSNNTKVDKALIRDVWGSFNFHVAQDNVLLITLEDETRWAMKNKLAPQTEMPDYLSYFHLDSLRSINPDAIRMNR
jgi:NitT/TauT family transport system substrate-binding protein